MFSDTRVYLWYLVLLLSVVRKEIERWNGKTEQDGHLQVRKNCMMSREKKTVVEEKRDYCETLVKMVACS